MLNANLKDNCNCLETIIDDLLSKMPDTTAFEDLPDLSISTSAPLGGKNLGGSSRVKKQVLWGAQVAAERKKIATQRAANQLVNILNTFIGID